MRRPDRYAAMRGILCGLLCLAGPAGDAPGAGADESGRVTKETFETWRSELSNWGRWGAEDQLGTLNLIDSEKRRKAATLVHEGAVISLSRDLPKEAAPDNPTPLSHEVTLAVVDRESGGLDFPAAPGDAAGWTSLGASKAVLGSADSLGIRFHGFSYTHLDALCHIFHEGQMYNGHSRTAVTSEGAAKLDVRRMKQGIVTRGVLFDIPRLKGVPYLEPGTPVLPQDLDAWEELAGVKVEAGDAVLIRTGRWARRAAEGPWDPMGVGAAGPHPSVAKWLKDRDVALVGTDSGTDLLPSAVEGVPFPFHELVIVAMGMPILDNADLETLGEAASRRKGWVFLFTAAPLPVPGGTGSPVNPLAIF